MVRYRLFVVILLLVVHLGAETGARIIGGVDAKDGSVPYLVAFINNGKFNCGGSIVGDRWILTAAHCVVSVRATAVKILAGTNHLFKGGKYYAVDRILPYESYNPESLYGDIALLRLNTSLAYGKRIQKVELVKEMVPVNATISLMGWGYIGRNKEQTNKTQIINVLNIELKRCRKMFTDISLQDSVYEENLCTFSRTGQGSCGGDSGSPVTWNGKQVAVVNWGEEICASGYPDVHARISYFYDWIQKTIAANAELDYDNIS